MGESGEDESASEQIATGIALVVMGLLAVVLLAANVWWWWMAFPIGGGLIPLAQGLARRYGAESEPTGDERQDALDHLRARYARGELTEAEFERRLERLLETETVVDAHESLERERLEEPERDVE